MAVLLALVRAGVCVIAPQQTLEGHKVQAIVCSTSGMVPEPEPIGPGGRIDPLHPKLLERG